MHAIETGEIARSRGKRRVFMGPTRKAMGLGDGKYDYYPVFVEYGHAGPHPAIAHPFMRPAFDHNVDQAYSIIRDELIKELEKQHKL